MIGAVVGVQPFGGFGLSGTGPKAGGPHYLARFATEQTVTVNTAAAGGNAVLMAELDYTHPTSAVASPDNIDQMAKRKTENRHGSDHGTRHLRRAQGSGLREFYSSAC